MSKEPPKDHDPILSEILKQLEKAFSSEVSHVDILQELQQNLQESWSNADVPEPRMMVLEGGKSSMDSHETKIGVPGILEKEIPNACRPTLALVEDSILEDSTEAFNSDEIPSFSNIEVHVVKPDELFGLYSGLSKHLQRGLISLKAHQSQQVAFLKKARVYRITCDTGFFMVVSDEKTVRIQKGQSLDMEGCDILVQSPEDATGFFEFLEENEK